MKTRRSFLLSAAVAAFAPQTTWAQSGRKPVRIGVLANAPTAALSGPRPSSLPIKALISGLSDVGYVYGQHYVIEARGSGGKPELFPDSSPNWWLSTST